MIVDDIMEAVEAWYEEMLSTRDLKQTIEARIEQLLADTLEHGSAGYLQLCKDNGIKPRV